MRLMQFGTVWMYSRSRRRLATARREPRLIPFLLSLVRVHLQVGLMALSESRRVASVSVRVVIRKLLVAISRTTIMNPLNI